MSAGRPGVAAPAGPGAPAGGKAAPKDAKAKKDDGKKGPKGAAGKAGDAKKVYNPGDTDEENGKQIVEVAEYTEATTQITLLTYTDGSIRVIEHSLGEMIGDVMGSAVEGAAWNNLSNHGIEVEVDPVGNIIRQKFFKDVVTNRNPANATTVYVNPAEEEKKKDEEAKKAGEAKKAEESGARAGYARNPALPPNIAPGSDSSLVQQEEQQLMPSNPDSRVNPESISR